MRCAQCEADKLSVEFPETAVTDACEHIPTNCLRCLAVQFSQQKPPNASKTISSSFGKTCPECDVPLSQKDWLRFTDAVEAPAFALNVTNIGVITNEKGVLQPKSASLTAASSASNAKGSSSTSAAEPGPLTTGEFYVVLLTGERFPFSLKNHTGVQALKTALKKVANVEPTKQKLIFQGTELNEHGQDSLAAYGIGPGSYIQLIIILFAITSGSLVRNVTFRLYWGYPATGKDYLDGTCLVFRDGPEDIMVYDYMHRFRPPFPHIKHSGDVMDDVGKRGHHEIVVDLANLPPDVRQLYFVLSSFQSPTIGHFPNPSFQMFDRDKPTEQLCSYTIANAKDHQAVILACVSRTVQGWQVAAVGRLSLGNVNDYDPIIDTITTIMFDLA
ncbi:TerD domain-containing protein [Jimgerdemannia flammicorona]|uniref:TerD domain-containing protein n=1 Tax=Jimgerdemannia flammicorona TaxID=994334 RepID=A0A433QYG5_9FUNG|nr:TerD domain-containing protein [Jimgerdemannia flammicorona]